MKRLFAVLLAVAVFMCCAAAGAEGTLEGKPYPNSYLYGNWPSERPAPEQAYDLYVNFDTYKDALAKGDVKTFSNLDASMSIARNQLLALARDQEKTDPEAEILRILYNLLTDMEKRNAEGIAPLTARTDRIRAAKTPEDLTALLAEEGFLISNPFFTVSIQASDVDPALAVIKLNPSQIIPDQPIESTDDMSVVTEPVKDTARSRSVLQRLGYSEEDAARLVNELVRFDQDTVVSEGTDTISSQHFSFRQLREKSPALCGMLKGEGLVMDGAEEKPMYQLDANDLAKLSKWYTQENLEIIKAAVCIALYRDAEIYLDEATGKASPDWDNLSPDMALYYFVKNKARIPMDQAYLKHFTPMEKWQVALNLFDELKEAMRLRIRQNTWMDEATKKKAEEKLDQIYVIPLEPKDGFFDCEPMRTALRGSKNLLEAVACCTYHHWRFLIRYAGNPCERDNRYTEGTSELIEANGVYVHTVNLINIGAPALNDMMFDNSSRETLLGTIGSHLAHELSHAFDTEGAKRDATGNAPLYTEEISKYFIEKATAIIERMKRIELLDGVHPSGELEITEMLADLTGLSLSLDLAKKDKNFDYEKFFRAYAKLYSAYVPSREEIMSKNQYDPHPSPHIRINYEVAQFEEFYKTYPSVTEGTPMYIAPEDRILVW